MLVVKVALMGALTATLIAVLFKSAPLTSTETMRSGWIFSFLQECADPRQRNTANHRKIFREFLKLLRVLLLLSIAQNNSK